MRVFVISLKSSIGRRDTVVRELASIDFEFFDADNLKEKPDHFIFSLYDIEKTRKYKGYELTVSELGCFASHISLWRKCVGLNKPILIVEDNIKASTDLACYLDEIRVLTEQYGILKLSNSRQSSSKVFKQIDEKYRVTSYLKKSGLGTQGYGISPRVARAYLNKVPSFFEPVDDFMEHEWRTKQTVYSLEPNLLCRSEAPSTIGVRKVKTNSGLSSKVLPELYRAYSKTRRAIYNLRYK